MEYDHPQKELVPGFDHEETVISYHKDFLWTCLQGLVRGSTWPAMHVLDIIEKKLFLRHGIAAGKNSVFLFLPFETIFKLILQLQIAWLLWNYLKLTLMPKSGP